MTTTIAEAKPTLLPLDATQVRALRHADKVIFRLTKDGTSWLEATRDAQHTADGFEQTIRIPVATNLQDFGAEHYSVDADGYTGFHMSSSAQYDDHTRTLVHGVLRTGDEVTLRWVRGNNNEAGRGIGWHRDELRLVIQRGSLKRRQSHLVAVYVGPDNTARMILRNASWRP